MKGPGEESCNISVLDNIRIAEVGSSTARTEKRSKREYINFPIGKILAMAGQKLTEQVASSSELPTEQAVASLRDVILGNYPNDAESVKAKELVRAFP